jgi:F-type H+-transporting ATPase subunit b
MRRLRWLVSAAFAPCIFAAAPLLAAEGNESAADTTIGWVFRWLNFALVFGGGGYILAKYAPSFFRRRADVIAAAINEAARVKAEAEQRRREAEAKLADLDKEIAEMRAKARRDADAEVERIRALARDEQQKIERAADAEIQAAERAARMELKTIGGRLAIERAEALLREEMTPKTEAALFRNFLAELEGSAN